MAARSVTCIVKNESKQHNLVLCEAALDHGIWSASPPPDRIPFGTETTWGAESDGFMTGTEGHATYSVGDTGAELVIYWDNPFVGANTFTQALHAPKPDGGAGVPDYAPFDPMRPDTLAPRFTSTEQAPPLDKGDQVSVTYRFAQAESEPVEAEVPTAQAPPAADTRTVSAPAEASTAVRCPAGPRKVTFIGCTYFSSYGESRQLARQVDDLTAVLPEPSIDKWLMDDAEFKKRTPSLDTVRDKITALENADDPVSTTLYAKPPPKAVTNKPRVLMIRALAKMLAEVDSDINPKADCLAFKRLVISGHHCGAWTDDREDVVWGSTALGAVPDQVLTLFDGDGAHGVLGGLAKIFPKAFLQVEDLCFSACVTGYLSSPIPPAMFAMFQNLRTIWAYENESPNAQNASANPFWSTSNRAIVDWEIASRNAGSEDAIDKASRALRAKFKGMKDIGKSIVWVQGNAREVND